jgi:hypothetical protein
LLGSSLTAAAATRLLTHRPIRWWWRVPLLHTHTAEVRVFWVGVVLLCVAWAGLGRRLAARGGRDVIRPRQVVLVGALWSIPLILGPALFSLDMYSYLAQGSILVHGLNPYTKTPDYLWLWHEQRLFFAVSTTWRHTTAPYGPVFLALAGAISSIAGNHLAFGITLMRLPELAGLGLLSWSVPRLARSLGADPARATWLAVISPLSLLYLVAGGHNDALMAGLLVSGVALAVERRWLVALALCALAATIKLPGAAGIAVVGVCWLRAEPRRFAAIVLRGGGVVAAIVAGAGLATGVGLTWISGSLFSTPETVHLAITPATAVAVSLWELVHGRAPFSVGTYAQPLESTAITVAVVLVAVITLVALWRVRRETLPRYLGLILIAAAIGGPAAWPWYLCWGVVLLAADGAAQRSVWLPAIVLASVFPVMAGGQVGTPLPQAPQMLAVFVLAVAAGLVVAVRRRVRVAAPHVSLPHVREPVAVASPDAAG